MFEHNKIRKLLSAYLDQEVSPKEKDQVETHMKECSSCKKYFQQLKSLKVAFKSWPEETLSPDLEQKIQTQIAKFKDKEREQMKHQRLVMVGVIGSFLAVVLMLVFGQVYYKRCIQGSLFTSANDISQEQFSPGNTRMQLAKVDRKQYEPAYLASKYESTTNTSRGGSQNITWDDVSYNSKRAIAQYESDYMSSNLRAKTSTSRLGSQSVTWSGPRVELPSQESEKLVMMGTSKDLDGSDRMEGYYSTPYNLNSEEYETIYDNDFQKVQQHPLSTFSIDVDTASYSNIRRFINENQLPPSDSVRIEEMVNYFAYHYPQPKEGEPFSTILDAGVCPWNKTHRLLMIGIQGKEVDYKNTPPAHLVFLIDVSGSMADANKLPLLKDSLKVLVNHLRANDKVSIVTYSSTAKIVLKPTLGFFKNIINYAIDHLSAEGSTAGSEGLNLAYKVAEHHLIKGGNNRVILSTDGDFNVGPNSDYEIQRLIEQKRKTGVFLTVLGFGTGNLKDSKLQKMADKGNGNYAYISDLDEAKKVLESQLAGTLFTVAKDVKIQVEFNPAQIKAYRLIGYENRKAKAADFTNDRKDGGDLGAGHSVTAFYEVVLED